MSCPVMSAIIKNYSISEFFPPLGVPLSFIPFCSIIYPSIFFMLSSITLTSSSSSPISLCHSTLLPLSACLSSPLPSVPPLSAPGRDQRLQLRVYAALQLDSGHRGPQPQHRVQPHSLWVRAAGPMNYRHMKHSHWHTQICRNQTHEFVSVYIQQTLQRRCRKDAGLSDICRAATPHMTLQRQSTQFILQSSHVIP